MASPANSISTQMTLRLWALLALLGLIWGGSFFFARVAVAHVPPFTLVFMRLSLAALALHFYLLGRHGIYQALAERWREFLLMGLINNAIPHAFIFLGQTHIGAGLAAILNATTPIWTVVIANVATEDEKLSVAKFSGCLLGLAGTIVLIVRAQRQGSSARPATCRSGHSFCRYSPLEATVSPAAMANASAIWHRR